MKKDKKPLRPLDVLFDDTLATIEEIFRQGERKRKAKRKKQ